MAYAAATVTRTQFLVAWNSLALPRMGPFTYSHQHHSYLLAPTVSHPTWIQADLALSLYQG